MRISSITKNAGKACNNRLYRHIRTFEKIVKNYFVIYNKCDERLAELVYANTSITKDFLDGIADREYYMFPEEAKELGIVDTIVGVDCPIDEIL